MGLDMHLIGHKYLWHDDTAVEDGYPIREVRLELGYWRKHPNLHGYIVNTFAQGNDDQEEITLPPADIDRIIEAIQSKILPHTTGFFFGASDGTDEEAARDVAIFQKAKDWIGTRKDGDAIRLVTYRASW